MHLCYVASAFVILGKFTTPCDEQKILIRFKHNWVDDVDSFIPPQSQFVLV